MPDHKSQTQNEGSLDAMGSDKQRELANKGDKSPQDRQTEVAEKGGKTTDDKGTPRSYESEEEMRRVQRREEGQGDAGDEHSREVGHESGRQSPGSTRPV